ncbi:MAG TPA: ribosome biogenesis GTP-binding protein YihA/YsxC [Thermodesulfobacteriota bacterium]|nr:ribosome biogenesis GTP-binding protein YihA/YsxC [Thermodesulfobacteriota bacterium]
MRVIRAEFLGSAVGPEGYPKGDRPEIAVAGRSNVGKSSVINALVQRRGLARTSATPGRTRALNFFLVDDRLVLTDLPGYGYAKVPVPVRAAWGPMIEGYLTGRRQLAGVLVVLDLRRPPGADDLELLEWLAAIGRPYVLVATKADKLSGNERARALALLRRALPPHAPAPIVFSAVSGEGRREVWRAMTELVARAAGRARPAG